MGPDRCLDKDYAVDNYTECCANGGFQTEGHGKICRSPYVKCLVKNDDFQASNIDEELVKIF